ncbi:MAG: hypothetical protein EXR76_13920 [Myxococcales bacterium]|nr:hypothetical protein [Myxococcales bacterium]
MKYRALPRLAFVVSTVCPSVVLAEAAAAGVVAATEATPSEGHVSPKDKDVWPVSGSVGMSYAFNHANFVPTEGDAADYGTGVLSGSVGAGYSILDNLSLDISLSISHEVADTYYKSSAPTTVVHPTEMGDGSLGLSVPEIYKIPVVDITLAGGVSASLPLSKGSQASGVYTTLSPGISASWSYARVSLSGDFGYDYSVLQNLTQQIEADTAQRNIDISGADTGSPLQRHGLGGGFGLGVKVIEGLRWNARYSVGSGIGAVSFKQDEFTSPRAQTGTQYSMASHGLSTGVGYTVFDKTSVSFSMATRLPVYNKLGERTVPIFDTESDNGKYTRYSVGVSQGF